MSRILITGATGTVGHAITALLAAEGEEVIALARNPEGASELVPDGVALVAGDVSDRASIESAADGCDIVYHAAGLPEQWRADPGDFARVNAIGTRNVADACLTAGVDRLVYTSTIDVFAQDPGIPYDEARIAPFPGPTAYEDSKLRADRIVVMAIDRGLDAIFLHPSAVYGPAPVMTGANGLIADLACGRIPMLLPGGMPMVHAEDVARGHVLAARSAPSGSRFILAGDYLTLREIAFDISEIVAGAKVPPVMPIAVARVASEMGEAVSRLTRKSPLIPRGALHFLESHTVPNPGRARDALGWNPRGWRKGLAETLAYFDGRGWLER